MCLGVPAQIVAILDGYDGQIAMVDKSGHQSRANIGMLEDSVGPGDWVIVHMGFAMETVSATDAARISSDLDMTAMLHEAVGATGEELPGS